MSWDSPLSKWRRTPRRAVALGVLGLCFGLILTARAEPPPTLDALLGLDEPGSTGPSGTAPAEAADETPDDMQRVTEPPAGDLMQLALARMTEAAERLNGPMDESATDAAELATRRLQREALDALDALIAQINRQSPTRDKSGGSSASSSQPQQADAGSPANAPRSAGGASAAAVVSGGSEAHRGGASPGRVSTGGPAGGLEQTDAADRAWGGLPAQIRGELSQGLSDPFSAVYQRLTEAYYQRLAGESDELESPAPDETPAEFITPEHRP